MERGQKVMRAKGYLVKGERVRLKGGMSKGIKVEGVLY